jgi:hypothetical protein
MRTEMRSKEFAALKRVTDDLRRDGFKVIVKPQTEELPDFLRDVRPDAIAEKDEEHVLIEVSAGPSMERAQSLSQLTELVRNHPEWQLRVIRAEDECDTAEPELSDLRQQLADVEGLYRNGHRAAALLLACSIFEGVTRIFLRERDEPVYEIDSISVIKNLVAIGEVEQQDFDRIRQIFALRNEVAHGNVSAQVDRESLDFIVGLAGQLLDRLQPMPCVR